MPQLPRLDSLGYIDDLPARNARLWPDKPALILPSGETALTYARLEEQTAALAEALRAYGVREGARIAIAVNNTPNFFVAFFGVLRAGAVAVPIDTNLSVRDLSWIVDNAQPAAIIVHTRPERLLEAAGTLPMLTVSEDGSPVGWPRSHDASGPVARSAGELALLLYTSGTTGTPKGVMHSHSTIMARIELIRAWFGFTEEFRALCLLPTHFGHGLICNCLATFNYGGSLVLCRPFDLDLVRSLWSVIERCQVNTFSSVPAVVRLLLMVARGQAGRPASLRFVTCASAPLRAEEVSAFAARVGVPLLNCYGITETASWNSFSPVDATGDPDSVGTAFGSQVRAVDDAGRPLPDGETGELQIRGPAVMLGYYRSPQLTADSLIDGWFVTGDIGRVDSQGRVYLTARKREVINRAGMKIYPAAVDAVLLAHPAVAEAYACGLADAILGEKVVACVVLRPGESPSEADLLTHCRSQLAPYQCPDRIRILDAVPKTSRGKVNRANLAQLFKG